MTPEQAREIASLIAGYEWMLIGAPVALAACAVVIAAFLIGKSQG